MIQPDAKCVVNGAKVNEAIMALNPLLAMSVGYIAGGKPPQVTYSDGEVKILLPLADSVDGFSLEELDIVDTSNAASSRYFMTSTGSVSTYGTTTASTSGTPTGKQSTSQPTSKDRNSLGNTPNDKNRDKLDTGGMPLGNSGGNIAPPGNVTGGGSGALRDDGSTTSGGGINSLNRGGVDQFGNSIGGSGALLDDGSTTAGGGINSLNRGGVDQFGNSIGGSGALLDDGSTTAGGGINSLNNPGLPGAPPLGGDTNTAARQQPKFADTSRMTPDGQPVTAADLLNGNWIPTKNGSLDLPELERLQNTGQLSQSQADLLSSMSGQDASGDSQSDTTSQPKAHPKPPSDLAARSQVVINELTQKLYEAKKDDKLRYDWDLNMWVFKKFGDPDSDRVTALKARLKQAKEHLAWLMERQQ